MVMVAAALQKKTCPSEVASHKQLQEQGRSPGNVRGTQMALHGSAAHQTAEFLHEALVLLLSIIFAFSSFDGKLRLWRRHGGAIRKL